MTDIQKEFIITFFTNEDYPGWKNIATKLVESGVCIVAGDKPIWLGGIGNFIKTDKADGFFGCLKYTFDVESFKESEWFKDVAAHEYAKLLHNKKFLDIKINDFTELIFKE